MSKSGSYQIQNIASSVELEINRLKAQVELFWDKEFKRYVEFGLRDNIRIAEIGSGPGFVTEKILEKFPNAYVSCVDIDPLLVDYARKYLTDKNYNHFEVNINSATNTGLKDNDFDLVIVRLLLEHLPEPVDSVREVFRILKPGGKAIFVDNDFEMHIMTYPHILELRELYDAYCKSRYSEGGNPKIGRELPAVLKKGGFEKIDFEIINAHSDVIGEELFSKSEGIGIPYKLMQDGFLTSAMLGKISISWRNMLKNKEHSIIRQLYMAVGEK